MTSSAIGPATEARIIAAFSQACLITADAAADLLGMDVKTLRTMTEASIIRAVRRGRLPAYTEGDIRAYLTESPAPCRSTSPKRAPTGNTTSSSKVVGFMARRASKAAARQSR